MRFSVIKIPAGDAHTPEPPLFHLLTFQIIIHYAILIISTCEYNRYKNIGQYWKNVQNFFTQRLICGKLL